MDPFSRLSGTRAESFQQLGLAFDSRTGGGQPFYEDGLYDQLLPNWADKSQMAFQRDASSFFPSNTELSYPSSAGIPIPSLSPDIMREDELGSFSTDMSYFDFSSPSTYNTAPALPRASSMVTSNNPPFYFDGANVDMSTLQFAAPASAPAAFNFPNSIPETPFIPSPSIASNSTPYVPSETGSPTGSSPNVSPIPGDCHPRFVTKVESEDQDQEMDDAAFSAATIQSSPQMSSNSPPELTHESDSDDAGESEVEDNDDEDEDFVMNTRSKTRGRPATRASARRAAANAKETQTKATSPKSSGSSTSRTRSAGRPRGSKATAPTPVPNLTKKSRGRRVPTSPVLVVQGGVQKNVRTYTCSVKECGKCFARGEHLKRHVRSIHTNEKRESYF